MHGRGGYRPKYIVRCLLSLSTLFFFAVGFFTDLAQPVGQHNLGILLSLLPNAGVSLVFWFFNVSAGDPNSSPLACMASHFIGWAIFSVPIFFLDCFNFQNNFRSIKLWKLKSFSAWWGEGMNIQISRSSNYTVSTRPAWDTRNSISKKNHLKEVFS